MIPDPILSMANELLPLEVGLEELGSHHHIDIALRPLHVPFHAADDVCVVGFIRRLLLCSLMRRGVGEQMSDVAI